MKKKIIIGLTTLTLMFGQLAVANAANTDISDDIKNNIQLRTDTLDEKLNLGITSFKDIKDHWAESSILNAVKNNYANGYPDGTFLPNNKVSRAEFIKMTVAALNIEVDSSTGHWYTSYVEAAKTAGLYINGDFSDSDWTKSLSREEMSKIAVRALGITKIEDKQWMYLAAKYGIITGTSPGEITPTGLTTRAQAVAVIERVLSVNKGAILPTDKYAIAAAEMYWHKTNIFTVAEELFNDPENKNDNFGIKSWKTSKLIVAAPDGSVKGEVVSLTAIDWNDPKDPNRKLLPSKDKLYWSIGGKETQFTDDLNCYVILLDSKLTINKKPKSYPINRLSLSITGFDQSNLQEGKLSIASNIISKDSTKVIYGLVIPKMGFKHEGQLHIGVEMISAGAPVYRTVLSRSRLSQ